MNWFRSGLKAHRLVYHSTLGWREMKMERRLGSERIRFSVAVAGPGWGPQGVLLRKGFELLAALVRFRV